MQDINIYHGFKLNLNRSDHQNIPIVLRLDFSDSLLDDNERVEVKLSIQDDMTYKISRAL